jgi:hypothetical protein
MKNSMIKLAVLAALGASAQAFATGLVTIPAAGFASSAYTLCNTTGNFGSGTRTGPTVGANNTCAVFPTNELTSPVSSYTLVIATTRRIPSVTGGTTSIGNLVDYVWRKPAATAPVTPTDMCIFGTRVGVMTNTDHDTGTAGTQYFELDDVARGGFSTSGDVNAGYFIQATNAFPVFRIGRTFTSVQHRAAADYSPLNNVAAPGYLALPGLVGSSASINGLDGPLAVPTAAQQAATVNSNWVDFTTKVGFDFGALLSGVTYVQAPCNSTAPSTWVKSGAIRLRQTISSFKEIAIDGFAPPGAVVP